MSKRQFKDGELVQHKVDKKPGVVLGYEETTEVYVIDIGAGRSTIKISALSLEEYEAPKNPITG